MEELIPMLKEWFTVYGLRVVGAILIFLFGRWIARGLTNLLKRVLTAREVEGTLVSFASHLTYAALVTVVVIASLNQLGVQTTSFVAIIGAAGLAIGLALQGSLSNFAAGVLIIMFRPFKVGDLVDAGGVFGVVEELDIFTTQLRTPDNKTIIVPNGQVTGGSLINYSAKETRRVDLVFGCGYDDDVKRVKALLEEIVAADERILDDPAPTVAVLELADSSVNFAVRPWVKAADYWGVYFDLQETVKTRFDAEGISIPYPQQDVHMHSVAA